MPYRPDIDGLRAIAVLLVICFHAAIPGFAGGFVGMDVFFVISGYLITNLLGHEMDAGTYSLASFYERRARRIAPALLAVIVACVLASWFILKDQDLAAFHRSAAAAALFVSNILFWLDASYFRPPQVQPLVHTWSLSVEVQFYLIFPFVLLLVRRWGGRWLIAGAVIALFVMSVWAAEVFGRAYFLMPVRAWQFLLGALLAFGAIPPPKSAVLKDLIGGLGLAVIVGAAATSNLSTSAIVQNAVAPCLGTALIIYAGEGGSRVSSLLSLRPVIFVGLISYSLYLWHWPLLAFANYLSHGEVSLAGRAGLLMVSVVLAALSLRFIERPFRRTSRWRRERDSNPRYGFP